MNGLRWHLTGVAEQGHVLAQEGGRRLSQAPRAQSREAINAPRSEKGLIPQHLGEGASSPTHLEAAG